jgi:hypothetical protein
MICNHAKYYWDDPVKEDYMGEACSTQWKEKKFL